MRSRLGHRWFSVNLALCFCLAGQHAAATDAPGATKEGEPAAAREKPVDAKDATQGPKTNVEESEDEAGVKTFKFSAVEVEGRLKSPQILYFMRRVRAEFRAGLLGHRSFLPELSDTRRSRALQ